MRVLDDIALHPEGKCSKGSLESLMLQIGAPNPGQQSTHFSLSLNNLTGTCTHQQYFLTYDKTHDMKFTMVKYIL